MSETNNLSVSRKSFSQRLFLFLGSMDLAITLLLALAVASIIGTVLQQNQPYSDYLIKFGPFWFELFESAGLYDVYSAIWFLSILVLLVTSTSVCVIRNGPSMVRDMWNLRTHVQRKSLRAMRHNTAWTVGSPAEDTVTKLESNFSKLGFRVKQTPKTDEVLVSAMRGGMNRLGYLLTHLAIVVICLGGLMDSNLPLKFAEWQGRINIETRDLPLSQIPAKSKLAVGSQAFRGSVNIPEGQSSSVVFVAMRDGYLVQNLPFKVEVKDFRIEHYATGQPKSFESDLVVYDDDLAEPLTTTIAVNHPLIHKGYAIYQASFSDGGSALSLDAWPLDGQAGNEPLSFDSKVFERRMMHWGDNSSQLEITSFRPFNINPDPTEEDPNNVRNFGPSIEFKLRSNTGEAQEYQNYMLPVTRNGRDFYLSGVRSSPADEFGYLYLPLDKQGGLTGFSHFLQRLYDKKVVDEIAREMTSTTLNSVANSDEKLAQSLHDTLMTLVEMFVAGGFSNVTVFIETTLPEAERATLGPAYLSMLREILARVYVNGLYLPEQQPPSESELLFLQDAVDAIGSLPRYGSPVYFELTDYEHVEASGLQIAQSPGKPIVYFGCAMLIMGVFLLFYLPQRRFWALVKVNGSQTDILLAGMSNRNPREFDGYFEQISDELKLTSGNSSPH
ncbi:MAG: cytochrome c biogenesis protein ResB [Pseudomonadota bacterium]|nr:cytochrome c biogenesis protein ResB [Pseudomonadota bacterium]MDO7710827.1 cytochrome c biogenesis protein ResB [Pseudomonadota bacterium]